MNNLNLDMGKRIAQLRNSNSMTQEKLAEQLNISIKHCSAVERGTSRLSLEKLIQICTIFDTTLDYLVYGKTSLAPSLETTYAKQNERERKVFSDYLKLFEQIKELDS